MHKLFEIPSIILFLCAFCAFLWQKTPRNQRNLRLIKDLRAYMALYICRDTFTDVMSALQIKLFMQNKAKFRKSQMNVNNVLTNGYENKTLGERGKKQSQTNPNKPKFKKAKMNITSYITKGYENKTPIRAPKKQSQISKRQKTIQPSLPQGIMKKTAISASGKTNPNKPNQTQCLSAISVAGQTANLLMDRMNPKLLSFRIKNSLTGLCNSVEYWVFDGR